MKERLRAVPAERSRHRAREILRSALNSYRLPDIAFKEVCVHFIGIKQPNTRSYSPKTVSVLFLLLGQKHISLHAVSKSGSEKWRKGISLDKTTFSLAREKVRLGRAVREEKRKGISLEKIGETIFSSPESTFYAGQGRPRARPSGYDPKLLIIRNLDRIGC